MYNLELWSKLNGRYVHSYTLIFSSPYSLLKGIKNQKQAGLAHFQFLKIVKTK